MKFLFRVWQCVIIATITLAYGGGVILNCLVFLPLIFFSCRDPKRRRVRVRRLFSS